MYALTLQERHYDKLEFFDGEENLYDLVDDYEYDTIRELKLAGLVIDSFDQDSDPMPTWKLTKAGRDILHWHVKVEIQ